MRIPAKRNIRRDKSSMPGKALRSMISIHCPSGLSSIAGLGGASIKSTKSCGGSLYDSAAVENAAQQTSTSEIESNSSGDCMYGFRYESYLRRID
jgi:hypothetical protein